MDSSTGCCGSPAPFLLKTYEMVDDPLTSCIVSWSDTGCSFVVWNSPEFCRDLLPKYFKHNNFSSFVRQLNTYGFRKVDPERWEFANRYFIKGKTDLLTNICRRKPVHDHSGSRGNSVVVTVSEREELEEEIGRLKQEKRSLESAVEKYKYENERYRNQIRLLGQMLINVGGEQPQMMASLTKFLEKPWYVEQPQGLKGKRRMLAYNEVNPGLSPSLMLQDNTSFSSGPSCIIQAVEKLDSSLTPWESFGHGINHTPSQIVKDLTSASAASYEELATEMAALSADSNSNVSQGTFLNIAASSRHADSPRISSKFGDPGHKLCEVSVKEIKDGEDGRSIPPLPAGTNDVFWEQFLIEAPVSSITQEV